MSDARTAMGQLMVETIAEEARHGDWIYDAVRPMPVPATWKPRQLVRGDCSKGCQYLARWGGGPDPMGNNWGPFGNSQTIWVKLHHLDTAAELLVGDFVTFGVDGEDHAAAVMEAGTDPLLWSFGHPGAPNSYRLSADHREHTYCRLPVIPPAPSPKDKLRAMTGFYPWVAWRLAEGPWQHYVKLDMSVRPNVPKVIPSDWWKRYATFLANRKKSLSAS